MLLNSEAAIPFKYLSEKGWSIDIVTEHGKGATLVLASVQTSRWRIPMNP
jgi:hypothetical protein